MTVLIVDDSKIIRMLLTNVLTNFLGGHNIFLEAENGAVAMQYMENHKVDLMMLDWNMPVMSGEAVVDAVRSNPKYKNTRIIMATTEGGREDVLRMIKKGVNGYLVKPFKEPNIIKAVEALRIR
ncbi:MAG: response regulator [Sulfuricurvum sp.]|uniref:response regulator n=1 Tax=Sulfuricurvum sp. TaxID=2025608 RepID=UPI00263738DA|nr:response regulator [Sulfuricurvum sp.]MDD2829160.1 response regulator [Sulfuricurvum sp.]MDD4950209.1 response regulator [Sulfuricurvum sp.]